MNRNEFNRFISGGALPGPGDLEGIRELTDLFPWFHAAHLVLLRGLKDNSDIRFESQLRSSALSVSDREVLYHYLFMQPAEAEVKAEVEVEAEVKVEEEVKVEAEAEVKAEVKVEVEVEAEVKVEEEVKVEAEAEAEVKVEVEVEAEAEAEVVTEEAAIPTRDELIADIESRLAELASAAPAVLELDHTDFHEPEPEKTEQFVETSHEGEELLELLGDEEPLAPEPEEKLSPADLIDRFIMTSPRIERISSSTEQPLKDMTESGTEEQGTFITETLARIYVNQGYYFKAINIYEKLSLKYPEKSAYFASRIEKIKELIK